MLEITEGWGTNIPLFLNRIAHFNEFEEVIKTQNNKPYYFNSNSPIYSLFQNNTVLPAGQFADSTFFNIYHIPRALVFQVLAEYYVNNLILQTTETFSSGGGGHFSNGWHPPYPTFIPPYGNPELHEFRQIPIGKAYQREGYDHSSVKGYYLYPTVDLDTFILEDEISNNIYAVSYDFFDLANSTDLTLFQNKYFQYGYRRQGFGSGYFSTIWQTNFTLSGHINYTVDWSTDVWLEQWKFIDSEIWYPVGLNYVNEVYRDPRTLDYGESKKELHNLMGAINITTSSPKLEFGTKPEFLANKSIKEKHIEDTTEYASYLALYNLAESVKNLPGIS